MGAQFVTEFNKSKEGALVVRSGLVARELMVLAVAIGLTAVLALDPQLRPLQDGVPA